MAGIPLLGRGMGEHGGVVPKAAWRVLARCAEPPKPEASATSVRFPSPASNSRRARARRADRRYCLGPIPISRRNSREQCDTDKPPAWAEPGGVPAYLFSKKTLGDRPKLRDKARMLSTWGRWRIRGRSISTTLTAAMPPSRARPSHRGSSRYSTHHGLHPARAMRCSGGQEPRRCQGGAVCSAPSYELPGVQGCWSPSKTFKDGHQCSLVPRMCQDGVIRSTLVGAVRAGLTCASI
jgi:hypothetical protein